MGPAVCLTRLMDPGSRRFDVVRGEHMAIDLLLLRHGETALNRIGALRGHLDVPLTERGLQEAGSLANRIAEEYAITAVYTSPLQRAHSTAAAVAALTGAPVVIRDNWLDLDWGPWAGRPIDQLDEESLEVFARWRRNPAVPLPGTESPQAVRDRAMAELNRLVKENSNVAVVSHDAVIQIVLCEVLGLSLSTYQGLVQSTAALNLIHWNGSSWSVRIINSTWHLDFDAAPRDQASGVELVPLHRPRRILMLSAGGVVTDSQGQVLVLQTAAGEWVLPKGKRESGESASTAALREVHEETGVTADILRDLGITSYTFEEDGLVVHKSVHWFLMRAKEQAPFPTSPEFAGMEWIRSSTAIQRLTWDEHRQLVAQALSHTE